MSGSLCCCKHQQHAELLAHFGSKYLSGFCVNAFTKMRAPLTDCHVNNALIMFVLSCQDTW